MDVILTQHPVGQGGMMSGFINSEDQQFQWVYDCGSDQLIPLNREIDHVAARGDVDVLFLSHLDSDHINGLDRLLSRTTVKQIVLPYLTLTDRLVAAGHDLVTGRAAASFFQFLGDIENWFGQRGVGSLTYIHPHDDGDDGQPGLVEPVDSEGDNNLTPVEPQEPGRISTGWHTTGVYSPDAIRTGKGKTLKPHAMDRGAYLLTRQRNQKNWVWVPYAHRPADQRLQAFSEALTNHYGTMVDSPEFLRMIMGSPEHRRKLRDAYELIWSNHNLVSMALYTGPLRPDQWSFQRLHPYADYWRCDPGAGAWLGTGDMHLNVRRRRDAFLAFYDHLLPRVHVFGLPHHGSVHNFSDTLLRALPGAEFYVAASGPNPYGHPSPEVRDAVEAQYKQFCHVSHRPTSSVRMHCKD